MCYLFLWDLWARKYMIRTTVECSSVCFPQNRVNTYFLFWLLVEKCWTLFLPILFHARPSDVGLGSDAKESNGRPPGGGHGTPLQYSCLGNPMDRGVWRATVHGVTQSRTRLKQPHTHAHTLSKYHELKMTSHASDKQGGQDGGRLIDVSKLLCSLTDPKFLSPHAWKLGPISETPFLPFLFFVPNAWLSMLPPSSANPAPLLLAPYGWQWLGCSQPVIILHWVYGWVIATSLNFKFPIVSVVSWIVSPKNTYSRSNLSRNGIFADIVKLRWAHTELESYQIQYEWCPYKKKAMWTQGCRRDTAGRRVPS